MASSRVIGLDIGSTGVRAAELSPGRNGKGGTLERFGSVPLPAGAVRDGEVVDPETVATALRQLWSQEKFTTRDVVIGVGNQRVIVRDLDVPWLPPAQLRQSLPFQVQELLPMPIEEALLDFHANGESVGPQGRMVHGMLVAAQRDTVTANVRAVQTAGLRPVQVDLNGFALQRALVGAAHRDSVVAVVEIGATVTHVVVADHGVPRLVRTIPAGGQNVTSAVAGALGVSSAEAEKIKRELGVGFSVPAEHAAAAEAIGSVTRGLVEAVRNTFVYYAGNHPGALIEGVLLTGGGAHLPGLGQYLASASRLPVAFGNAVGGLSLAKSVRPEVREGAGSLVALSVGLAQGVAA
ncbi:type IV pilus assembly protein PilM [Cellulomonas sp. ACRRI]|uniref:type IV pilus assembly protein PilM n=1 Tax=Cellulomonas sp. ACRRI TaxID=2918188 RepID=UPI001EF301A2|nr:type IV pilus assembly protein PilM [Cellulomonas sp. ACRRI]MCG7285952.1 type IV pilus assembly protein PilM [Cellulomonas sp. ACRRI]